MNCTGIEISTGESKHIYCYKDPYSVICLPYRKHVLSLTVCGPFRVAHIDGVLGAQSGWIARWGC